MASSDITNIELYPAVFRRRVLLNAKYWQNYVNEQTNEVDALDHERDRIIKAISFALDLEETWPYVRGLIETFSPHMERRGFWDSWNRILKRAIMVAHHVEDVPGVANLSGILARLLYRQSRFEESTAVYRQAIRLSRQIGDQFGEARACTNLGYAYIEQGRWYRAEVLCCHALKVFEQIDSNHGRAHTENHLGILYTWQGLWVKARQHLERACDIWQLMNDHHGLMYAFLNLCNLCVKMARSDEALLYAEKALHQAQITGAELELGKIYNNMGVAYKLRGELSEAEAYQRQAETIFRRLSNTQGLADVFENLGIIYLEQQKWAEAHWHLESALETWRTLNNKHDEIRTMIHLGRCELARGSRQGACVWLKEVEHQLSQHPQAGQYYQLRSQKNNLRRSLTEGIASTSCGEKPTLSGVTTG